MPSKVAEPGGSTAFASDYIAAIQGIRGSITDILTSIKADTGDPADIAERLGIHKLLAWRLSKIVTTSDAATPMRQIPGAPGLKMLGKAFKKAGAPEDRVEAFHSSIAKYRQVVERHAGDAAMLEVMLASQMDDPAFADETLNMRKHAFRGAAAVWGAYARVQQSMSCVAPTQGDDELLDLGSIAGLIDFRALRQAVFWPVTTGMTSSDAGTDVEKIAPTPQRLSLVPQFCSTPLPEFDEVEEDGLTLHALKPGTVGKTGTRSWMVLRSGRGVVSRYRDAENELGQHSIAVHTPVELVQYDLLIHRDLTFELPPEALMCGDIASAYTRAGVLPNERYRLPMTERVEFLGSQPPILSSPHSPSSTEMGKYLCAHFDRELDEFTAYRLLIGYPPILANLFLRHPLMTR